MNEAVAILLPEFLILPDRLVQTITDWITGDLHDEDRPNQRTCEIGRPISSHLIALKDFSWLLAWASSLI